MIINVLDSSGSLFPFTFHFLLRGASTPSPFPGAQLLDFSLLADLQVYPKPIAAHPFQKCPLKRTIARTSLILCCVVEIAKKFLSSAGFYKLRLWGSGSPSRTSFRDSDPPLPTIPSLSGLFLTRDPASETASLQNCFPFPSSKIAKELTATAFPTAEQQPSSQVGHPLAQPEDGRDEAWSQEHGRGVGLSSLLRL